MSSLQGPSSPACGLQPVLVVLNAEIHLVKGAQIAGSVLHCLLSGPCTFLCCITACDPAIIFLKASTTQVMEFWAACISTGCLRVELVESASCTMVIPSACGSVTSCPHPEPKIAGEVAECLYGLEGQVTLVLRSSVLFACTCPSSMHSANAAALPAVQYLLMRKEV